MAEAQAQGTGTASSGGISSAWRVFQAVGLLVALSWLGSWLLVEGYARVGEGYGGLVFALSPLVSLVIIAMAVSPGSFAFLNDGDWKAWTARIVLFVIPFLWMYNVMFGGSPMVDKLFDIPLQQSKALPIYAGVFLHVVFQHWFQGLVAITIALVPEQFAALTESPTPAGLQCAVVDCE